MAEWYLAQLLAQHDDQCDSHPSPLEEKRTLRVLSNDVDSESLEAHSSTSFIYTLSSS